MHQMHVNDVKIQHGASRNRRDWDHSLHIWISPVGHLEFSTSKGLVKPSL